MIEFIKKSVPAVCIHSSTSSVLSSLSFCSLSLSPFLSPSLFLPFALPFSLPLSLSPSLSLFPISSIYAPQRAGQIVQLNPNQSCITKHDQRIKGDQYFPSLMRARIDATGARGESDREREREREREKERERAHTATVMVSWQPMTSGRMMKWNGKALLHTHSLTHTHTH